MSPMRLRGKTAPEIYTTVKHLRETERGGAGGVGGGRGFTGQTAEGEQKKKEGDKDRDTAKEGEGTDSRDGGGGGWWMVGGGLPGP